MFLEMANQGERARTSSPAPVDVTGPRHVYPEPLSQAELDVMACVLPDDVTAAHLRWLEMGEGDPWGGNFG